ncbi:MAG TPA: hypothetical protein PK453_03880 [Leptospiraceae bacterium]|nr:hypothetical protein [Leptospiraceae bacterium]HNM05632.1 hypothetical protein [Leptospiraceae bacterium]HNN06100.1 hypothetical protein [Leptospiraceae bacterium]HNO23714.1 hypothetical protein [Leptospiraceae bacterium]
MHKTAYIRTVPSMNTKQNSGSSFNESSLTPSNFPKLLDMHRQKKIPGGSGVYLYGAGAFRPGDTYAEITQLTYNTGSKTLSIVILIYGAEKMTIDVTSPKNISVDHNGNLIIQKADKVSLNGEVYGKDPGSPALEFSGAEFS